MGQKKRGYTTHNLRTTSATLRDKLLEKFNYACVNCGITNSEVSLELAHLVAVTSGGETTEENLTVLCPNCHAQFDRKPREIEFVSFLSELLKEHPNYNEVNQEVLLGGETRFRGDILAKRKLANASETLLIDCKTSIGYFDSRIGEILNQLIRYKHIAGNVRLVLAIPATLREQDKAALINADIELWDLQSLVRMFFQQIPKAPFGYYKVLLLSVLARPKGLSPEQKLLNSLSICRPGKEDWQVYQSLIGDILENLFTPPLGKPMPELSDKVRANRRDFIMSNYAEKGFWAFLREKYQADYVVIDAKNYARKIKKTEILQIANYLKPHGAGLFGMIFSRKGGDLFGCEHTLREQWLVHRKMILVLDDDDIQSMLISKSDGNPPEVFLGQKIEQFRLSM